MDLPAALPIFPLPGALLLPLARLPLNIFEPRYLEMISQALSGARLIGMIQPRDPAMAETKPALYHIGCAGRLVAYEETDDGRFLITLKGISRFSVARELAVTTPYRQVAANWADFAHDLEPPEAPSEAARLRLSDAFKRYLEANGLKTDWKQVGQTNAASLVTFLAVTCPFTPSEKQGLLECRDAFVRADMLISLFDMAARGQGGPEPADQGAPPLH